jgi:hypothetical protein
MARLSEEFKLAWSSLASHDSIPGWQAINLTAVGSVGLRAGKRSPDNAEAILLEFPCARFAAADKLPEGVGFAVERANPEKPGQLCLALTRRPAGNAELFTAMVCDVVGAMDESSSDGANEKKLLQIFISRVSAWQEFMRKGAQALSPEAEIGLIGELIVLRSIIDAGVTIATVIESWVGPLDGIQDFELGFGAVEVKTTLANQGFPAKINSLEQLDDCVRKPIFLAGIRLKNLEAGKNLPEMAQEISNMFLDDPESTRIFSDRLLSAGFHEAHSHRYSRRFIVDGAKIMQVFDGFPRMTPGTVPSGIRRAIYEIDLDSIVGHEISMSDAMNRLEVL